MAVRAQSSDGKMHEFPDGTAPEVVDRVMKSYATQSEPKLEVPAGPDLATLPDTAPQRAPYRNQPGPEVDQQALFEQREKTPKGTPEYDALTKQIARAQTGRVEETASFTPVGTFGKGVAGAVTSRARPAAKKLIEEGVRLTPGQEYGGVIKKAEDALTSLPFAGHALASGARRSVEDLNRTVYNRVLGNIGEKYEGTEVGREGVGKVWSKLSAEYDKLKPRLSFRAGPEFAADTQVLAKQVGELPQPLQEQAKAIFQNKIVARMGKGGTMDGETFKEVESELTYLAGVYRSSNDPAQRLLGQRIGDMTGLLRDQLERSNPAVAGELRRLNTAWAAFTRLESAAANRAGSGGVFTPGDLATSVKKMDRSARKGSFARGDALLQDLSDPAAAVLPSSIGDSGTAGRLGHMNTPSLAAGAVGYPLAKLYLGANRAINRVAQSPTQEFPNLPLPAPDYRNADDAINGRQ